MSDVVPVEFDIQAVAFEAYVSRAVSLGIGYELGAKDPRCGQGLPIDYKRIDCSGFTRTLLQYSVDGMSLYPDGSFQQANWCGASGMQAVSREFYQKEVLENLGQVVVWFAKGSLGMGGVRHTWLTVHGHTIESCGGVGVSRNNPVDDAHAGIVGIGYVIGNLP